MWAHVVFVSITHISCELIQRYQLFHVSVIHSSDLSFLFDWSCRCQVMHTTILVWKEFFWRTSESLLLQAAVATSEGTRVKLVDLLGFFSISTVGGDKTILFWVKEWICYGSCHFVSSQLPRYVVEIWTLFYFYGFFCLLWLFYLDLLKSWLDLFCWWILCIDLLQLFFLNWNL